MNVVRLNLRPNEQHEGLRADQRDTKEKYILIQISVSFELFGFFLVKTVDMKNPPKEPVRRSDGGRWNLFRRVQSSEPVTPLPRLELKLTPEHILNLSGHRLNPSSGHVTK